MTTLLKINSSILASGNANRLIEAFVAGWRVTHADGRVIQRDLTRKPIPYLDETTLTGFGTPPEKRTPEQQAEAAALSRIESLTARQAA